jgi:hypothetical protein
MRQELPRYRFADRMLPSGRPEIECEETSMPLSRRGLLAMSLLAAAPVGVPNAVRSAPEGTRNQLSLAQPFPEVEGDKIGPPPVLPTLPPRPYPHRRRYLYTDGTTGVADSWISAMRLSSLARAGVARSIPYGIDIETDQQKLWLLGRTTFTPRFAKDANEIIRDNGRNPFRPSWRGLVVQQYQPMKFSSSGGLEPDIFD